VRPYDPADFPMVNYWWTEHTAHPLNATTLPPLGVLVCDAEGPAGALWCYESFGTGVAMLEWPVTRPGLSGKQARAVMAYAVAACVALAGKTVDPPAVYRCFRVATLAPIARFLTRLGFVEDGERVAMTLDLTKK
jgi:hypothetical protein